MLKKDTMPAAACVHRTTRDLNDVSAARVLPRCDRQPFWFPGFDVDTARV